MGGLLYFYAHQGSHASPYRFIGIQYETTDEFSFYLIRAGITHLSSRVIGRSKSVQLVG
jgi:hypothetical protein